MTVARAFYRTPRRHHFAILAVACAVVVAGAARAGAQTPAEGAAKASMKIGELALTPSVSLSDVGYDSNVFNVPQSQGDFTATFAPQADLWLPMGRSWLTGGVREEFVYFQEFSSERSVNGRYAAGWYMPINRVAFNVDASYLNTRQRQGFDIDARSRRMETEVGGAIGFRASDKTTFSVFGRREGISFDQAAIFAGSNLRDQLSRHSLITGVEVRRDVTPLTSVSLEVSRSRDRFDFTPLRDSDSTRIAAGVRLDAFALVSGSASFGYRRFEPLSSEVPGFDGLNWMVDLSYTALVWTRFSVQANRDIQYSYDIVQPYYVQTGVSGEFGQQIRGPVGMTARAALQHLDYQSISSTLSGEGTDRVHAFGGGIEYRIDKDVQLFVNVDRQQRSSRDPVRQYSGLRCTTTLTYQF